MPVDTTRTIPTRRTQRKITEEELKDIEMKRIRGELSCAECRRLKLRCDKKVPCGSCCRRGCESICPCGILSAGQGTRFILADTEQLHSKIAEMSHRIRQLEDALAIFQSTVSDERHPLLTDELVKIKFGAEALSPRTRRTKVEDEDDEDKTQQSIDAIGTLTLNESGDVKYFGQSAGSETLMAGEEFTCSSEDEDLREPLPTELDNLSNLFPFTRKNQPKGHALEALERYLPPHERAWTLGQSYIDHGALFFRPIKREELVNSLLPNVYNAASQRVQTRINNLGGGRSPKSESGESGCGIGAASLDEENGCCHALATLFFVFALGALLDLKLGPFNAEAERYYDLGRAALSLRMAYDSPSIDTVQAIGLMATYHTLAARKYSRDSAWCLMSFAAKLAQSIGLHRDSSRWSLGPVMVEKRRNLFWEIFAADVSHSLALGRPPAIHLSFVDCEFPADEEATLNNDGQIENGFWRIKHQFARDVFMAIAETTLTAKPASYAAVLNLDRKVREVLIPQSLMNTPVEGSAEYRSSSSSLRAFYATQHRTVPMLYLHRSFFAQAMLDHPTNPLLSPFSPSFLTAYRSASMIIQSTKEQFERSAEIGMRIWFLLYHTFSAAIIVGTIVTRSPNSSFAPRALYELEVAIGIFEQTAKQSPRARIALNVLSKLKEKATRACAQFSTNPTTSSLNPFNLNSRPGDELDDELAIFGGQKRVLARKAKTHKATSSISSNSGDSPSPCDTGSDSPSQSPHHHAAEANRCAGYPEVHPMLLQYLNGATFHSPPRQNATIPGTACGGGTVAGSVMPPSYVTEASSAEAYSALYGKPSEGSNGTRVGTSLGYASSSTTPPTPSSTTILTPTSRSSSVSSQGPSAMVGEATSGGTGVWQGKVESMQLQLSDAQYLEWLSSASSSPFESPTAQTQQMRRMGESTFGDGGFVNPAAVVQPPRFGGSTSSSAMSTTASSPAVVLPPSASGYDIFGMSPGAGYFSSGYGFNVSNSPVGTMVELGVSSESGMDARWMTFVQDCGILDGATGLQTS
ncbi:hypothetical protein AX17_006972 [Amanita inopinata Kibby_2008]|nr:hypothetical protein AX17_006972 [Amanita inopinata Kibby_2008]